MSTSLPAPFNRRVRVLAEVVDDDDEVTLAEELLGAEGWPVRAATAAEAEPLGPRRRGLVVEVRLQGARRGARQAAEKRVARVAGRAKLALWVRQAVLLEPPRQRRTTYVVRLRPPAEGTALARGVLRLARRLGGAERQRAVTRPGGPDLRAALHELTHSPVGGGRPFDPDAEFLEGPADSVGQGRDTSEDTRPETAAADGFLAFGLSLTVFVVSCVAGMACGGVFQLWDSPLRWTLLVPTGLLSSPLGPVLGGHSPRRVVQLAAGAAGAAASFGMGHLLLSASPVADDDLPVALPLTFLGVGTAAWTAYGVWKATAHSWFSRNAHWLVPALAVPVPVVLTWFGKVLFTVYLDHVFGIPVDAVPIPQSSLFLVALKPVGVATGCALFFLGVAGWARHTYRGRGTGDGLPSLILPLLTFQYVVTALASGVLGAGAAAHDAAQAARQGRQPAAYFGLDPALMCARPLAEEISVYNGPLATDRPLLTFGSTDGRVWLWGPQQPPREGDLRWAAASVRLEDVSLTAPKPDGDC